MHPLKQADFFLKDTLGVFQKFCQLHPVAAPAHPPLFFCDTAFFLPFFWETFCQSWETPALKPILATPFPDLMTETKGLPPFQQVTAMVSRPPFVAAFPVIVVCLLCAPTEDLDSVLKQWANCLSVGGSLLFCVFGEMTGMECLYDSENSPASPFLARKYLLSSDEFHVHTSETWMHIQHPKRSFVMSMMQHLLRNGGTPKVPSFASVQPRLEGLKHLTFQILCGKIQRTDSRDGL